MNEKLENLFELPTNYKIGILLGSVLVLVGMYWLNLYSPVAEESDKMSAAIDGPNGLRVQIAQQEGIAQNLDKFREEVGRLDVELNKALAELPDQKEIAMLLSKISDKAKDSGLEVLLFKPKPVDKKDFYAEVPVQIQVYGTYHEVATFFDEVGHLDRIVNLDEFWIKEPEVTDEEVTIQTEVTATAFRFLEESERPESVKEGEEGKAKARRRGAKKI